MITFDPIKHKYVDSTNTEYISVTTLLKKLEQPKDWNLIAEKYAKKHGGTANEWRNKWDEKGKVAADRGTLVHAIFEDAYYNEPQDMPVFQHEESQGFKSSMTLKDLEPGIYPELLLYSERYNIAGQSDLVKIYDDKTFDIEDYKTDKIINFESGKYYSPKHKKSLKTMYTYPVDHLDECNWNKYQLQLSIYAYILEQYGFKLRSLQINHVITERDENEITVLDSSGKPIITDVIPYTCQYLKKEAQAILKTLNY